MPHPNHNLTCPKVIIGFGNQYYSDSSIGARVADEVATWRLPEVLALTVQQLTPDLSKVLAKAYVAIFVDASRVHQLQGVKVIPIKTSSLYSSEMMAQGWMKTSDPYSLIALTQATFGRYPLAYWIKVPAEDFFIGKHISPIAEKGIEAALIMIKSIIQCQNLPRTAQSFNAKPFPE